MKPSITSSNFFKKHKTLILRIAAIAFWIAVWEAVALRIGSELIIATPIKVAQVFIEMIFKADTWHSLGFSLVRISSGFALAFILGSVLAAASGGKDTAVAHNLGNKVNAGGFVCNTCDYMVRKQKSQRFYILFDGLSGDIS